MDTSLMVVRGRSHSYADVGMVAAGRIFEGFREDHNRKRPGTGAEAYELAKAALRSWTMFELEWCRVHPPDARIAVGATVGILDRTIGVWTLNLARVISVADEPGRVERFGFAYGSLPGHAEAGEEQFTVEGRHDDDSVWFDLHAFSRPGRWFSWLGCPITKRVRARFAVESMAAMANFVANGGRP